MKTLEVGNIWYFFYIVVCGGIAAAGFFPFRKATEKKKYIYVLTLSFVNFALHFLKLLLPEYQYFPMSLRKCTFENICAVSVLIYPFVMMSKSDTAKDYVVFLGMIGGAAAIFVPTGAWGHPPFRLESIRFYLSHILLFMQAFYTLMLGLHRPSYKRFWRVPISFFLILGVITLNEFVLRATGFTEETLDQMVGDPTASRNGIFIFGLPENMESKLGFLTAVVPDFMKHGFGYRSGDFLWPWVWLFWPIITYGEIAAHAIGFTWGWKELKEDLDKRKTASISNAGSGRKIYRKRR